MFLNSIRTKLVTMGNNISIAPHPSNLQITLSNTTPLLTISNPITRTTNPTIANSTDGFRPSGSGLLLTMNGNVFANSSPTQYRIHGNGNSSRPAVAFQSANSSGIQDFGTTLGLVMNGNLIANITPTYLTLSRPISTGNVRHLVFWNTPTLLSSSNTSVSSSATDTYSYYNFTSWDNQNWTPVKTNGSRIGIPENGVYFTSVTFHTSSTGNREMFLTKNCNNNNDLNVADERLIACAGRTDPQTTISGVTHLLTTDFINAGMYQSTGTHAPDFRCTWNITLLYRL